MTSLRQIEANRRNALRSSCPRTEEGKQRASKNAVRHGLTAETVVVPLEDAHDYHAFEQAVTADYDAKTAVEREFVLRLASLLWRLRRATSIETALLRSNEDLSEHASPESNQSQTVASLFGPHRSAGGEPGAGEMRRIDDIDMALALARRFARLADLDSGVFERLNRYEAALWRQARQTLLTLEALRWQTSKLRRSQTRHFWRF